MRPRKREELLRLDLLDLRLPHHVLIAWISHLSTRNLARCKWRFQLHTKPFAKLPIVCDRAPHPRYRSLDLNPFFNLFTHGYATSRLHNNPATVSMQPSGCV